MLGARVHERRRHGAARVVDEDVDAAELRHRAFDGRRQGLQVHHVRRYDERAPPALFDGLRDPLEVGDRASEERDIGTGIRVRERDFRADAFSGPRNDRNLSG